MSIKDIPSVPESINFPSEELKILELWKQLDVFRNCMKQSEGKPRYTFFDGPPFATGLPHYGHISAGTIKDTVTRYAHQKGFYVERRFGWDCHGLPVEFEIDKAFDVKGPDDVIKMGIRNYNGECRKIVTRYIREWKNSMERIGRWVDFENDYKTLYPWYMESVWWVFKELYNKGLVYEGYKVMPYSTACNTPLSNFECGQNYKEVTDPAVTVSFSLVNDDDDDNNDDEETALLIWTTTPWTLPSNLAVCVNPNLIYARIRQTSTKKIYILLEGRIESVFKKGDYEILTTFPGSDLKDKKYRPVFDYYKEMSSGAFKVLTDPYVSAEAGTGVVHQAPYFGEDDYQVCLQAGIITKDQEPVCPVDEKGFFTEPVVDFKGLHVKEADKEIIAMLKHKKCLIDHSQIIHSYPFCWRSDTPLIYRSISSWFIRVEEMIDWLKKTNSSTYWVPEFVKEKRFGNWLNEARDWAISRNRYWGTPIPIWKSESGDEIYCIGSIAELEKLTGTKITDLHKDFIDDLEIPSKIQGNRPLRRIPEVFDCWFESGAMPYAQQHYPFENEEVFEENFPADFIAEGIDQTRGWFYTLLVISTALFGKPPFKNLIANGLVLASDGQKMSKRKKNYPDPMEVVNKYGADALRLYLINSPVVRAENLNFKESGVYSVIKSVFLPWYNAFRFLFQNIQCYNDNDKDTFFYCEDVLIETTNIMDKWIISFTQSLLLYIHKEMELYHLYNVLPRLTKYFDHLTNCYVRFNRKRMKGEDDERDTLTALTILFNVLFNITVIMAPFAPFITETMYQYFKKVLNLKEDSVHYLMMPKPDVGLIDESIEKSVSRMQTVIDLGRVIRDKRNIPIRYPLLEIVVVHQDTDYLQDVRSLQKYVLSELNIRTLITTTEKSKYGIVLRAEPNYKMLGSKLKQHLKDVTSGIKALTDTEITNMLKNGCREIKGHLIHSNEINVLFKSTSKFSEQYEMQTDKNVFVLINVSQNNKTQEEGAVRELITKIQKLRKRAHLIPTDKIVVHLTATGNLENVIKDYKMYMENAIKTPIDICESFEELPLIILEVIDNFKQTHLCIGLTQQDRNQVTMERTPVVPWVNVELLGLKSKFCNNSKKALVLLETGPKKLSLDDFKGEISNLFGLRSEFKLVSAKTGVIISDEELFGLNGETIFVCHKIPNSFPENEKKPYCKLLNFVKEDIEGTLILENPAGNSNVEVKDYETLIDKWINIVRTYPKLFEY